MNQPQEKPRPPCAHADCFERGGNLLISKEGAASVSLCKRHFDEAMKRDPKETNA